LAKKERVVARCGYCLRGTEDLVKIDCTPDGGKTWVDTIIACKPCREYLHGFYRVHGKKRCTTCGLYHNRGPWNRCQDGPSKENCPQWISQKSRKGGARVGR
jgi:hypothetical protein